MGDQVRVQQVLLNMIKNAVKFTSKGYIYITVKLDGDFLLFKVIDSGIGISKEAKGNLLEAYYQADTSTTRKYGGTGLGLSICKSLVTAMKGNLAVLLLKLLECGKTQTLCWGIIHSEVHIILLLVLVTLIGKQLLNSFCEFHSLW